MEEAIVFCDSHIHIVQAEKHTGSDDLNFAGFACCSAHEETEFYRMEQLCRSLPDSKKRGLCFGLHPQNPDIKNAAFLERVAEEKRIVAIGEAGFDFFTEEFRGTQSAQEKAWNVQLELAQKYKLPLVIHSRKSMERLFKDAASLKKINSCVFHSFPGTLSEAGFFLRRNVNAYFSFGKPLLNGAKKAIECMRLLPADRILLETDAPFQTLKGESFTSPRDIERVYKKAAEIRGVLLQELCGFVRENFLSCFSVQKNEL